MDRVFANLFDRGWVKLGGTDEVNGLLAEFWADGAMKDGQPIPETYLTIKYNGECYTVHPSQLASKRE